MTSFATFSTKTGVLGGRIVLEKRLIVLKFAADDAGSGAAIAMVVNQTIFAKCAPLKAAVEASHGKSSRRCLRLFYRVLLTDGM